MHEPPPGHQPESITSEILSALKQLSKSQARLEEQIAVLSRDQQKLASTVQTLQSSLGNQQSERKRSVIELAQKGSFTDQARKLSLLGPGKSSLVGEPRKHSVIGEPQRHSVIGEPSQQKSKRMSLLDFAEAPSLQQRVTIPELLLQELSEDEDEDQDSDDNGNKTPSSIDMPTDYLIRDFSATRKVTTTFTNSALSRQLRTQQTASALHNARKTCTFVLEPTGSVRLAFDAMGILMLVYDLFITPVIIAWNIEFQGFVLYATMAVVLFWTFDIVVMCCTGFFHKGQLEMRFRQIFLRYLKTLLLPDVIFVALDWMVIILSQVDSSTAPIKVVRTVRFLRLLNTSRIARVSYNIERLVYRLNLSSTAMNVLSIARLLCITLWINHLLSCLLWTLGAESIFDSDTGETWVTWPDRKNYKEQPWLYQYTTALHWAYMQMGTGNTDVVPTNSAERIYGIFTVLLGMLFFSWFVSSLSTAMMNVGLQKAETNAHLAELNKFLRQCGISPKLSLTIQKHVYERLTTPKPLTLQDVPTLKLLTHTMRADLQAELCLPYLQGNGFFRVIRLIDFELTKEILVNCTNFTIASDVIFDFGTVAEQSYIVDSGNLRYIRMPGSGGDQLVKAVKHRTMLSEATLWVEWKHVGTLFSSHMSSLLEFDAEKLCAVLSSLPDSSMLASEYARCFRNRLIAAGPPSTQIPDDLDVPFASFEEIIVTSTESTRLLLSMLGIEILKKIPVGWSMPRNLDELTVEVEQDRCLLMISEQGDVSRLVAVTVLELTRAGGNVLAEVGSWSSEGGLKVSCKLPGTKQNGGETPAEAVQRLLQEQCKEFKTNIDANRFVPSTATECSQSPKYNIRTKYLRTIFSTSFTGSNPESAVIFSQQAEIPENAEEIQSYDVFALPGKKSSWQLYAWIEADDLSSESNEGLTLYLNTLDFKTGKKPSSSAAGQSRVVSSSHESFPVLPGAPEK
jgi:hypothetical protein